MSLREALGHWRTPQALKTSLVPERTKAVRQKLETRFGKSGSVRRPTMDLNRLYSALEQAVQTGTIRNATTSDLKWAPWVLFTHPATTPGKLVADKQVLQDYLTWAGGRARPRQLLALLYNFLLHYPSALPTFHLLRQGLEVVLSKHSSPKGREAWERCRRYALLDADGPTMFAEELAKPEHPVEALLEDVGFDAVLERGKFMESSYAHLLHSISTSVRTGTSPARIRRILDISARPSGHEKEGPRFGQGVALANALLLPFANGGGAANQVEDIKRFLVQHLGDPRIVSRSWQSVAPKARGVILSWLVKASLEDFFNILSATADSIWSYRKKFWSAYLSGGYIQEAWVVLGTAAASVANRHLRSGNAFGQLAGAVSNQSVLLMRIGSLIVAEWSHNGTCRIWDDVDQGAPGLYLPQYQAADLRAKGAFEQRHMSSITCNWQHKIHDYIRSRTNITLYTNMYC